jgi:hypothetical protein
VSWLCRHNEETRNTYKIVVGKYRRKVLLWRTRRQCRELER